MRALSGAVDPMPYALVRAAIAATILVRTTDVLAPLVDLDHHAWVRGIEGAPWSDVVASPRLVAPLVPGLEILSAPGVAAALVIARTALAGWLLTGIFPRATAGLLAAIGWSLMASDRFRYLHHLHLLWLVCALLALCPSGERLALRRLRGAEWTPRWPLQLLRLQALVIYAASGIAKLRADWIDGTTVRHLAEAGLLDRALVASVGARPLALATLAIELALVPLLAWRRTRVIGIGLGLSFHAATSATMMVSTFPWTMAILLATFLPWRERDVSAGA